MREKAFICDLCHARVKEKSWEHQAAGLYLNVYLPCGNPMGEVSTNGNWQSSVIKYEEVCNDCREAVAAQIAAAVKSRLAKADPPPSLARQHSVEGEEIMVNTPYDVFTLPLQPSGLSSGPRFVVHVPGPERPAAVDGSDAQAAGIEALRAEVDGTIRKLLAERDQLAAALAEAQHGLRYAVRVWVLSDEIEWSEAKIDEVVESIIGDAKNEARND